MDRFWCVIFLTMVCFVGTTPPVLAQLTAEKISASAAAHVDEKKYGAVGKTTRCSEFARDVVEDLLGKTRPEMQGQVKDQFGKLKTSPDWEDLKFTDNKSQVFKQAQELANQGNLVLVVWNNPHPTPTDTGHIAIVVKHAGLYSSGKWGIDVPYITQAGPMNPRKKAGEEAKSVFDLLELSWGFSPEKAPDMKLFRFKK